MQNLSKHDKTESKLRKKKTKTMDIMEGENEEEWKKETYGK